ncbi:MAG TPA: hypothetical protein VKX96_07190 [Chloroflexota bacterium]|nr:hypothetical protein [Chloroflexota bacterium]
MAKTDFERRANQIRAQIEDLRDSLDDILGNYNGLMASITDFLEQARKQMRGVAQQAQQNASEVSEGLAKMGFSWWLPVAIIAAVGIGIAVFNSMRPQAEETLRHTAALPNMAGQTPTFNVGEQI